MYTIYFLIYDGFQKFYAEQEMEEETEPNIEHITSLKKLGNNPANYTTVFNKNYILA